MTASASPSTMPPMNRSRLPRPTVLVLLSTALVVGFAAPASAVVSVTGDNVNSDASGDLVRPGCSPAGTLGAVGTATTGSPCATLDGIDVFAGPGADTVDLTYLTVADFPQVRNVEVDLGDDTDVDTATGSVFPDSFLGGYADSASGGAGDDTFDGVGTAIGGEGDDVFLEAYKFASGGAGDDRFVQFTASSGIEGGEGFDTWEADIDQTVAGYLPPSPTFYMTPTTFGYTVDGLDQSAPISGIEQVIFTMPRQSDDTWQGTTLVAFQTVRGLSGNDTVLGGALADHLLGGTGNDALSGGAGPDLLEGGPGDDTINARNGEVDTIVCGDGTDTVVADAGDLVTGCEVVQLPPVPVVVPATKKIKGKASYEKGAVAKFTLRSDTAGATFQCKLDKGGWKSCKPTHKVKTAKLKLGKHTLRVRAVVGGTVDPTPAKKKFRVTR